MLHERTFYAEGAHRSWVPDVVRWGMAKIPVKVIACGLSATMHLGLFAGAYFVPWSPEPISSAELQFAKGDRAIQVMLVSSPWPDEGASDAESFHEIATVSRHMNENLPVVVAESNLSPPNHSQQDSKTPSVFAMETECDEETRPSLVEPWERPISSDNSGFDRPNREAELAILQVVDDVPTDTTLGVDTGVEVVNLPQPKYPLASFRRGEDGLVMLEVEVLLDGSVGQIEVVRDAGFPRLSAAAIAAVRQAVIRPAMRRGMPVRDFVRIPFRFVLR